MKKCSYRNYVAYLCCLYMIHARLSEVWIIPQLMFMFKSRSGLGGLSWVSAFTKIYFTISVKEKFWQQWETLDKVEGLMVSYRKQYIQLRFE